MGSKSEEKSALKRSWFRELKAEFRKIIWPEKSSLVKKSIAVIIIALIVGCIVALVDMGLMEGLNGLKALVQQLG